MSYQTFNYDYFLKKVKNLVRFNYRIDGQNIPRTLARLENSLFYYKEVLSLFNKNLKDKYHQISKIDFRRLGLSEKDQERFIKSVDDYVINKNYEAINTVNYYYNIFLNKSEELMALHIEFENQINLYDSILKKIEARTTDTLTAEEVRFLTELMNKATTFTREDKYQAKVALFWYKSPEFKMSAGTTLILINSKYNQIDINQQGVSSQAVNFLDGTTAVIEEKYSLDQLDEYFASLDKYSSIDKKYIYSCLINLVIDNINLLKDTLLADNFSFLLVEELDRVINDYNHYLFLINYLNKKRLEVTKEQASFPRKVSIEEETSWKSQDALTRTLILSSNDYSSDDKKSYIERDLDELPEECYNRVRELLTNFEIGNDNGYVTRKILDISNFYEIKYTDQLRILFSFGPNNTYIIKGVMQKKVNDPYFQYLKISERPEIANDEAAIAKAIEYSKTRYEIMLNFLETNVRKSNRY